MVSPDFAGVTYNLHNIIIAQIKSITSDFCHVFYMTFGY